MKRNKNASRVKEKQVKKDYAGTEASPYQEWREGQAYKDWDDSEPKEANPDVLSEEEALYAYTPFIDEEQVDAVKAAIPLLSYKQRLALQLVGLEGKTMENAAIIMGISRGNVFDLIARARKIILKNQNK